jgi:rhombotail lipoprotein
MRGVILAVLLPLMAGCFTTGLDRSALISKMHQEAPNFHVVDDDIAKVQALRPQLQFPCRIAVYLVPTTQWTSKEKEQIKAWGDTLKKEGAVTDFFIMTGMFAPAAGNSSNLKDARIAAAKHGADALLVLHGGCQTDSYLNPAALLNLTIVGGFLVPASHRDALFVVEGALIDVSNGFLLASMESEGQGKIVRPTFIVEEKAAVDHARKEAVAAFGSEFLQRMQNLHRAGMPAISLRVSDGRQ